MKSRVRKREFLVWSQSFQYLAWMHGYSKLDIAKNLMKNHATIISSINKVSNAIDGFNPDLKKIYEYSYLWIFITLLLSLVLFYEIHSVLL